MSSVDLTMSEDSEKPEEDNILEILDTRLLKPYKYPKIVYEGYLFHYHKPCKNHIRWRCNKLYSMNCPAVLLTTLDMDRPKLIKLDHEHLHEVDKSAINALKMDITQHRASSKFQNSTMFKPKNGYVEIKLYDVDTSVNKMLKQKNGYADIDFNEEDKPNKLVTCCTSYNQNVDPHDPNYEHRYTDEREQIIKNKNINDISFDFECPKIRITRSTNKQKKVFESILFYKAYEKMIQREMKTRKMKGIIIYWELKFESLKYSMKKFRESTKCDISTRHISIQSQNQNQMDTTCTNIGVAEKENNSGVNKKGLHHCVEVLVLNKDGQLSTMEMNGADWQSPKILKESHESVQILPVAIKRAFKSNLSKPSEYPILNKLLTKQTSKILKLDKRNTLNTPANNQMNASLPDDHLIRESNNSI